MIRTYCDVCDNEINAVLPRGDNVKVEVRLPKGGSLKVQLSTAYEAEHHVCVTCMANAIRALSGQPQPAP